MHRVWALIDEYDQSLAQGYRVPWWAEQKVLWELGRPSDIVYFWKEPGDEQRRYIKYPIAVFNEVYEFASADPVAYIPNMRIQAPKPGRFIVVLDDDWWFVIDARQKTVEYQGLDEELARLVVATMAQEFGNDR